MIEKDIFLAQKGVLMSQSHIPQSSIYRLLGVALISVVLLVIGLMLLPTVLAVEIPPTSSDVFIQTNGPLTPISDGDWYTSPANGVAAGYHYIQINIPCDWPAATPIHIDLYSAEMNSNAPNTDEDDIPPPFPTTFELYGAGTTIGPNPNQPGPGTGVFSTTYAPSSAPEAWVRFFTFSAPVACGKYVLRAESRNDDENSWRVRVGLDDDGDPTTIPPANYDNFDGIPGTNDEITAGITQISYQHDVSVPPGNVVSQCLTLYEFVVPGASSVTFHNFDLDGNQRVRYYAPSAAYDPTGQTGGIVDNDISGGTEWNGPGGSQTARVGYTIPNPEWGWWRIVTCANPNNQFIQEGRFGVAAYLTQPPTPVMEISKDDGQTVVGPNDVLTYTITFTNTSDTTPNPGAALNVVLTDTLPTNTTFLGCAVNTPTGACSESGGLVTFNITDAINAGATGSAWVAVQVDPAASGTVSNSVTLNYEDGLGNPFPPVTANDVDLIPLFDLELSKTDNGIITVPGGVITYTLTYSNTGVGNATGVVITETVPVSTTFNAAASAPTTWSCPDGAPAGTDCTTNIGNVAGGTGGSVTFAVNVLDPVAPQITNTARISDDGSQGPDPTPWNNIATDTTPVAVPDLQLNKTDDGAMTVPGGTLVYTLTYTNVSPVSATGVVITETVPNYTTFNLAASAPTVWSCLDGAPAGTDCTTNIVGGVAAGANGSATFAVNVADPVPPGVNQITNTARIADDGSQGPDPTPWNNTSSDTTPIIIIVDPIITKRGNVNQAQPGDPVIFSITVINPSPPSTASATDVAITDTLPMELDLVTYTVESNPPGLVGGTTVTTNTISTAGHPSGVTQSVVSTITVNVPTLGRSQAVTLVVTTTVNTLASPPPVVIENLAVLGFAQQGAAPRTSPPWFVNVPAPAPPANPGGGRGGGSGDDDDDDDSSPPPAAPQPPAAAAQPTPVSLPVSFLPETGLTTELRTTGSIKGVLLVLATLGVGGTTVFYLWRRNKKVK
jgi:uncharacterized repeat protein (TIGR01451 family)